MVKSLTGQQVAHKYYIPALDGIRGLAILMVLLGHYGVKITFGGRFGVTLFFFISGLLICRLLIVEFNKTRTVNLKKFYIRRILRLYPALITMICLSLLTMYLIGCRINLIDPLSVLLYFRNYYAVFFGPPSDGSACSKFFDIVWSLAVEEHFYIFFPVLFLALYNRRKNLLIVMLVIILLSLLWRIYLALNYAGNIDFLDHRIYSLSDTRLDAIMFGCLASLCLDMDKSGSFLRFVGMPVVFIAACIILICSLRFQNEFFSLTFIYSLQGIALFITIPAVLYHSRYALLMKALSNKILVYIGKLSYSVYLFHWLGVCIALHFISQDRFRLDWLSVAIPIGIILSLISYNFIELPINNLRRKFGSNV
ncbi:acyltransferase family protein [Parafilimonas sp.]|uniref:acyltransferase family protein n=1 Tax=Parafilimonas sp. TaxID=1969739 RepID=UPI0039E48C52